MLQIIVDTTTLERLREARQAVELCDPSGKVVGHFIPSLTLSSLPGMEPTISEEELTRRENSGGGRQLADILADLGKSAI